MQLGIATVLLVIGALAGSAAAERQVFCYSRVGGTRKYVEKSVDDFCEGPSCVRQDANRATHYKTELVYRTERHCCAGYRRDPMTPDICHPVCSRGCPQGERCTAPNRCECAEGHERDSEGRCVAVSAPLPGDEPATLQSEILSFVSLLLDGVKSLAWTESEQGSSSPAISALPRHEENLIPSENAGASCQDAAGVDGSGLQSRWLSAGALDRPWNISHDNCSSSASARPVVLPLTLAAPRLSTAQLR